MARVRDHAREYAALKARAQAAGLSTRAFRRARKAEPARFYAPRAQVSLRKRLNLVEVIATTNRDRSRGNYGTYGYTALENAAKRRVRELTALQRREIDNAVARWDRTESFFDYVTDLDLDENPDVQQLFWYHND